MIDAVTGAPVFELQREATMEKVHVEVVGERVIHGAGTGKVAICDLSGENRSELAVPLEDEVYVGPVRGGRAVVTFGGQNNRSEKNPYGIIDVAAGTVHPLGEAPRSHLVLWAFADEAGVVLTATVRATSPPTDVTTVHHIDRKGD